MVKYGRQALKDRNLFKSSHGPKTGDTVQLTPVKANRAAAVKRSTNVRLVYLNVVPEDRSKHYIRNTVTCVT